jgi:hypothetical protein
MEPLVLQAAAFVVDELLPTLAALAAAAGREPLGWGAIALAALAWRLIGRA